MLQLQIRTRPELQEPQDHNGRLRSTAEAPRGDIVVELRGAHDVLAEGSVHLVQIDVRFLDASLDATDLGSEEDAQVTLVDDLGAHPTEVGAMLHPSLPSCEHVLRDAIVEGAEPEEEFEGADLTFRKLKSAARDICMLTAAWLIPCGSRATLSREATHLRLHA